MAAPFPGAAKLDDAPTRPKLKLTNAAIKIARISHSPCFLEKGADGAPSMLWRLASACGGPRFGRRRRAFIRRSALEIAPYRDDRRHWLKIYALQSEQRVAGSFIACSWRAAALTVAHGQRTDSPSRRRGRRNCVARGAGGALSPVRALHHHGSRTAGRARRAQAGSPAALVRDAAT